MSVHESRKDYNRLSLGEGELDPDPIRQFHQWFEEATLSEIPEPNAMVLATASPDARPSARIVLLRGYDERGFVFFTNYESRKGRELDANPHAALVFHWHDLERQIRVEGPVVRSSAEESDAYFQSRPAGSRLGAWASRQSEVIADREILEARIRALELEYANRPIPRPEHWGGYRVVPTVIEFWQGRPSRLHDRLRYTRSEGGWLIERLSP
ncbi:MAG: pyridoxamine 5'-phosphate oxidase [Isosphaeraceae bacterium]